MTSGSTEAGVASINAVTLIVDDQLRTNVPGIWALGDCNGRGAFTHTAYNDAEIVGANLLDNDPREVSDRIPPMLFTLILPWAVQGMTETEVRQAAVMR